MQIVQDGRGNFVLIAQISMNHMNKLDKSGQRLLALLVDQLEMAIPGSPQTYVMYKQVHEQLGLALLGPTYGESLKRQGLASLADWTAERKFPGITGLIVDGISMMPGDGYFRLFHKTRDDYDWWAEQIRLSKDFDWSPYLAVATRRVLSAAKEIDEPAERESFTINRIVRDTMISKRVKMLHEHTCQICGHAIELSDGSKYAEAHHIRPLGAEHGGPDIAENILCVCPNHHVELDYGVRPLVKGALRIVPGHRLNDAYIRYHNEIIHGKRAGRRSSPDEFDR
ncbi:hypothetical protein ABH999_004281 [Bradyrhizobium yuanmingense]|uniref:HNH endonuclease n=1 Tax=Bradyrhizobium yuanmingense TaxID=108015 RepID=UPI0012FDBBC1|nr:HNH endonuclease [Bradyrhizobium yuanmingense]